MGKGVTMVTQSFKIKGWLNATDIEHFNFCSFSSLYFTFLKRTYCESVGRPRTSYEGPEEE
jgi:hypothetical protein